MSITARACPAGAELRSLQYEQGADHLRPRRTALWQDPDDDVAGAELEAVPAVAVVHTRLVAAHGRHPATDPIPSGPDDSPHDILPRAKTEVPKGVAQQYIAQHPPVMSDRTLHEGHHEGRGSRRTKASLCQGVPSVFLAGYEVPFGHCLSTGGPLTPGPSSRPSVAVVLPGLQIVRPRLAAGAPPGPAASPAAGWQRPGNGQPCPGHVQVRARGWRPRS